MHGPALVSHAQPPRRAAPIVLTSIGVFLLCGAYLFPALIAISALLTPRGLTGAVADFTAVLAVLGIIIGIVALPLLVVGVVLGRARRSRAAVIIGTIGIVGLAGILVAVVVRAVITG